MRKSLSFSVTLFMLLACGNQPNSKSINGESNDEITSFSSATAPEMNMDSYQSKYRGKKCSVQGPHDSQPCKCSGFDASNRDASVCRKCGHKAVKHTR